MLLVDRGLAENQDMAQRFVMAGEVRVEGEMIHKSSTRVAEDARIEVAERPKFVSRGGMKLAAAIDAFDIEVAGKICADVGASTGGFTDCLLQNGAKKVYAIDVGYGLLDWRLRQDPRVVVMERINARYLDALPETVQIVTIDASFISLSLILEAVKGWFDDDQAITIALVKPQFEAERKVSAVHAGVIKDDAVLAEVLAGTLADAASLGFFPRDVIPSPIRGPKGNAEFLVDFSLQDSATHTEIQAMIERVIQNKPNNDV